MSEEIYEYWQEKDMINVALKLDYKDSLDGKESLQFSAFESSYHATHAIGLLQELETAKHIDITQMDWSNLRSIEGMFFNDTSLKEIDLSKIDMDEVINISSMFGRCFSVKTIDLSNQTLEKVAHASNAFLQCYSLECLDISSCENTIVLKSILEYSLPHLKKVFVKDQKAKDFLFGVNPNIWFNIVAVN